MIGDEVGSALIGSRLVRDIMRLCFLMEQTYAPYAKWFGECSATDGRAYSGGDDRGYGPRLGTGGARAIEPVGS